MLSEEARKTIDALSKEELLLEINKGHRSRFGHDNFAYLKTRLQALQERDAAQRRNEDIVHTEAELRLGQEANDLARGANQIARRAHRWSKVAIAVALIAPTVGWLLNAIWPNPFGWAAESTSPSWRPLVRGPTGLSTEVVVADIPEPDVRKIAGQFKFVDSIDQGAGHTVRFGYKIEVDVAPLDLSKVPKRFLEEKRIDLGGGKSITQLPLTQSTEADQVRFEFLLKDRDGFTLMKLSGEPETMWTGKSNVFQRLLTEPVPENLAHRTIAVVESMTIEKCFSCQGG